MITDKKIGHLAILVADDEAGACAQMQAVAAQFIDLPADDWSRIESTVRSLEELGCLGYFSRSDHEGIRNRNPEYLLGLASRIREIEQDARNGILSDEDGNPVSVTHQEVEDSLRSLSNAVDPLWDKLPLDLVMKRSLDETLDALQMEHYYDVVISDWRFEGGPISRLGGLLVILWASVNASSTHNNITFTGFYTGYPKQLLEDYDASRVDRYLMHQHPYKRIEKGELFTDLVSLAEQCGIQWVKSADWEKLVGFADRLDVILSAEDVVAAATAERIAVRSSGGHIHNTTLYHLLPFFFLSKSKGRTDAMWERRKANLLVEIDKEKQQRVVGGICNFYTNPVVNKLVHELPTAMADVEVPIPDTFWQEWKPRVRDARIDRCIDDLRRSIGEDIGGRIALHFDSVRQAIDEENYPRLAEAMLTLKQSVRLRLCRRPHGRKPATDPKSFAAELAHKNEYTYVDELINIVANDTTSIGGHVWVFTDTITDGMARLVAEIRDNGRGISHISLSQDSSHGYLIIAQNESELSPVLNSFGIRTAAISLLHFCSVYARGVFSGQIRTWNLGCAALDHGADEALAACSSLITDANLGYWILQFPLHRL